EISLRTSQTMIGGLQCRIDAQVEGGRVVTRTQQPDTAECQQQPVTVDELFSVVERLDGACGPNGCGCDVIQVDVEYDPTLGFPKLIDPRQAPPTLDWRHPSSWLPLPRAC